MVRQADQVRYHIGLAGQHAAVDEQLAGRDTCACSAGSTSPNGWPVGGPTTGLDPRSRSEVWDSIRELVAGGTTPPSA